MVDKVRDTPQSIETIIHSLEHYALGDIKHNKCKPIAAFILSICFIEQLSGFLYEFKVDDARRPDKFFTDYMNEYIDINLYHKSRHHLVHNYSSRDNFDIDNIGYENVPYEKIGKVIHLNTNVFIHYLEIAFEKAKRDLENVGSDPYNNALEFSMYYPVLVDTRR